MTRKPTMATAFTYPLVPHALRRWVTTSLVLAGTLLAWPAWSAHTVSGGIVTDTVTGLAWDQCVLGLGTTATACDTGAAQTYTWPDALTAAVTANNANYKGYNDWRLPNKNELESIVKLDTNAIGQGAIDGAAFPNTPITGDSGASGFAWTSTAYAAIPGYAWIVAFSNGSVFPDFRGSTNYVRLVRSGQPLAPIDTLGSYTIGGTVTGLTGSVVLQNNAGDDLSVGANGVFTFGTVIPAGGAYAVSIKTQPAGQTCTVSSGSGTASANVTDVAVNCTAVVTGSYTIGGAVTGLTGSVVLQNNAGDDLSVGANGVFTFGTAMPAGGTYAVTVKTQPAGQTCTVSRSSGTANANVTDVAVSCAAGVTGSYTIGGTVTGLTSSVVLQNNAGDDLSVGANGAFTFGSAIPAGGTYAVSVKTQPAGQTCTVSRGSGAATANVTDVTVSCTATATAGVTAVPTLSEWAMLLLVGLLAGIGLATQRKRG